MKSKLLTAFFLASALFAGLGMAPAMAQGNNNTPGIDQREQQISQRIDEGVRSGRLTQREARRLHKRERVIQRHELAFKADGVVTQQERRQLRNELTALRDEVERMMRNDRRNGRG